MKVIRPCNILIPNPYADIRKWAVVACDQYTREEKYWKEFIEKDIIPRNNSCELYFEESDIEGFIEKLEKYYPDVHYVNKLMVHSWGQKVVRFYDPDGNLIEVGTPM